MMNVNKAHKKELMSGAMSIVGSFSLLLDTIIKKIFILGQFGWFWGPPLSMINNFEALITKGGIHSNSIDIIINNYNITNNKLYAIALVLGHAGACSTSR